MINDCRSFYETENTSHNLTLRSDQFRSEDKISRYRDYDVLKKLNISVADRQGHVERGRTDR